MEYRTDKAARDIGDRKHVGQSPLRSQRYNIWLSLLLLVSASPANLQQISPLGCSSLDESGPTAPGWDWFDVAVRDTLTQALFRRRARQRDNH